MKKSKIKAVDLLAETKFLSLFDVSYENKVGNEKHWTVASRKKYDVLKKQYFEGAEDKLDAVVIAALHEESGKLAIIRQFRVPLNDYIYELPAGLIDPDEDRKSTLSRELKEETGLELISINNKLGMRKAYLSPGMTDESAALIYCTCKGEITKDYLEEDEDIEALLISPQQAEELLNSEARLDIKLVVVLQSFVQLREKLFIQ